MDLDRTILGPSLELTPALIDAVEKVSRRGVVPIIATGRMLRSALPYARQLGITAPLICYQGALIAESPDGRVAAPPAGAGAAGQEVLRGCGKRDEHVNLYVDDELYVAQVDEQALAYARHGRLTPHPVGDLVELDLRARPPRSSWSAIRSGWTTWARGCGPRSTAACSSPSRCPCSWRWRSRTSARAAACDWVCDAPGHRAADVVAFGDSAERPRAAARRRPRRAPSSDADPTLADAGRLRPCPGRPRTASPASWKR